MLLNILMRDPLILMTAADNNRSRFMFLEIQLPFLSGYDFRLTFLDVECKKYEKCIVWFI